MGLLAAIGRVFISFLAATGRLAVFAGISVSHIVGHLSILGFFCDRSLKSVTTPCRLSA